MIASRQFWVRPSLKLQQTADSLRRFDSVEVHHDLEAWLRSVLMMTVAFRGKGHGWILVVVHRELVRRERMLVHRAQLLERLMRVGCSHPQRIENLRGSRLALDHTFHQSLSRRALVRLCYMMLMIHRSGFLHVSCCMTLAFGTSKPQFRLLRQAFGCALVWSPQ